MISAFCNRYKETVVDRGDKGLVGFYCCFHDAWNFRCNLHKSVNYLFIFCYNNSIY